MLAEGLNNLQNTLSIKVPLFEESRVGNAICGLRLCDTMRSRNLPYIIFAFTSRRLILYYPASITL